MVCETRHGYELSTQHGEGAIFSEGRAILWRGDVPGRLMGLRGWWALRTGRRDGLYTGGELGHLGGRCYRAGVAQEGRDEAVALPMHRFDQRRPTPMIAYCLAGSGQALRQRRFTHKRAGPTVLQEFIPRHHTISMPDEVDEHLKHLGLNSNDFARALQLIAGGVSNVDIDGNNALNIKAIVVIISTFETLPYRQYGNLPSLTCRWPRYVGHQGR
jgi:hypothetical protein